MSEKQKTFRELLSVVHTLLKSAKIEAGLDVSDYRNGIPTVISVTPKSEAYKALNYWEKIAYEAGLQYYLRGWLEAKYRGAFDDIADIYVE